MKYFVGKSRVWSDEGGVSDYDLVYHNRKKQTDVVLRGTFTIEELEALVVAAKENRSIVESFEHVGNQ